MIIDKKRAIKKYGIEYWKYSYYYKQFTNQILALDNP